MKTFTAMDPSASDSTTAPPAVAPKAGISTEPMIPIHLAGISTEPMISIHPREARGVVSVPGFELVEHVVNQEQPGRLPALLAEPTKSDKLQASPRGRVLPSCVYYTVVMFDSWGDGWQGAVLHVGGLTFTLASGSYGTAVACLDPGTTYAPYACGDSYPSEVSWSVGGVSGGASASCGSTTSPGSFTTTLAPTPVPTPSCVEYTVEKSAVNGSSGWYGAVLYVGGLTFTLASGSTGTAVACLDLGTTYAPYACGVNYFYVSWSVGGVSGGASESCVSTTSPGSFTATLAPTPMPTLTPMPTWLPTPAPTLAPTLTLMPTYVPTLVPTPEPTYVPTPMPTLTPGPSVSKPPTPAPFAPTAVTTGAQAQAAIDAGAPLVALANDLLLGASISIVGAIVVELDGQGFALDGQRAVRCLYVEAASVTIVDMTIRGGYDDYGGGLYARNAFVVMRRVAVVNNTAWMGGGGGDLAPLHQGRPQRCLGSFEPSSV